MEIIKENTFFVVMGVVVLVALALFFVLVQPMRSANAEKQRQVETLSATLQSLMDSHRAVENQADDPAKRPKLIPNKGTISTATDYQKSYKKDTDKAINVLKKRHLLGHLEKDGLESINAAASIYQTAYEKAVAELQRRVKAQGLQVTGNTWAFWKWDKVPNSSVQRELSAKEFVIIKELCDIVLLSELNVVALDHVEVDPGIVRNEGHLPTKEQRLGRFFRVYPFVLSVKMDLLKRELLIRDLLRSQLLVFVRTVNFERIDQNEVVDRRPGAVYIGVKIEGWVLDFDEKKQEGE